MREAIATGMKCEPPPPPVRLDLHATMMEEIRNLLADYVGHGDVCRSNHGGRERYDRSIHMEEYEKKSVEILDMFVEDWAEACEVNARLEAARNIKDRTISQCFLGAAVEKGYETYQL